MKRIAIIAVLFVFLINTMGYYIVFQYNQYLIKKEMVTELRSGVFHPGIVLLKIQHPEKERHFRRIEKNEFTFQGKLYDIVVERKSGDTTLFYCLHDKKEEMLLADFVIYLRGNGRSGSSHKDHPIHSLLTSLISQAVLHTQAAAIPNEGCAFDFPDVQLLIIPVYLAPFAPPPETA